MKRKIKASADGVDPKAAEGRRTEKQYFEIFNNPKVQVVVIPSEDNRSAPEYILQRLDGYALEYQIGQEDELWLMIDTDRWGERKLSGITKEAGQKGYFMAVSNPCFEVWLYLHLDDVRTAITACRELKQLLRETIGSYNSSRLDPDVFRDHISEAVQRAKALTPDASERWPASIGTHVYKVVERILTAPAISS